MWLSVLDLICCLCFVVRIYAAKEPEILVGPKNTTMFVDNSLALNCRATGDPKLTIQWQKRNGTGGRWVTMPRMPDKYVFAKNGSLVFKRLLGSDAGSYRCIAENSRGSAYSAAAALEVQAKAEIVTGPKDVDVKWGTDISLECEVVGIPFPKRNWFKDGQLILDRSGNANTAARLRVNATQTSTYTCTAQNEHMEGTTNVSSSASVRVKEGYCVRYTGSTCRKFSDANGTVSTSRPVVLASVYVPASITNAVADIDTALTALLDVFAIESSSTPAALSSSSSVLSTVSTACFDAVHAVLCRHAFPECVDVSFQLQHRPLCRESCVRVRDELCAIEWTRAAERQEENWHSIRSGTGLLPNCSSLPSAAADGPNSCSFVDVGGSPATKNDLYTGVPGVISPTIVVVIIAVICILLASVVIVIVVCQLRVSKRHVRRPSNGAGGGGGGGGGGRTLADIATASLHHQQYSAAAQTDDVVIDVDQLPTNDAYDASVQIRGICLVLPNLSDLECDRNQIIFESQLPTGAFGPVFVARASNISPDQTVVVKTVRPDADAVARSDFLRAGELVASLSHPNIIRVLGSCLKSEPVCVIYEHMCGGELGEFLHRALPSHYIYTGEPMRRHVAVLTGIVRQIASAMVYFSRRGYVHRDLAARNCLVGSSPSDGEPPIVKLSDFGLAVELAGRDCHYGADDEEIPVRWMPPESIIESRFAPSSDVWSFAVLAWEVFTFGAKPYDGLSSQEAARRIVAGRTLVRPDIATVSVYELLRQCWNSDPAKRPNFEYVHQRLVDLETATRTVPVALS